MSSQPVQSDPAEERYLLCSRKDGTGARLANLLWTWRLARSAGLRTLCFWPPMDPVHGKSSGAGDIFDLYALAAGPIHQELAILDGRPNDFVRGRIVDLEKLPEVTPAELAVTAERARARGAGAAIIETGVPILGRDEDEAAALEEVRALFARLPINRAVLAGVKAVDRELRLGAMMAVHVRRGDIVKTLRTACKTFTPEAPDPNSELTRYTDHFLRCCPPPDSYFRIMREYRARRWRMLFFSDSADAAEPFVRRFGPEIVLARDLIPEGLEGVQRAFFELLLMSRCRAIIGAKSLFSRVATMIGAPRFIDARRAARPEELAKVYTQAVRYAALRPEVREAVGAVFKQSIEKMGYDEIWDGGEVDIPRLLEDA